MYVCIWEVVLVLAAQFIKTIIEVNIPLAETGFG